MAVRKTFVVKLYDQDFSSLVTVLTTGKPESGDGMHLKNVPSFSSRLNGGLGQCVLDVKAPWDDFGEGSTIDFMHLARVYAVVVDDEAATQTTTLVYTGYVSQYTPYVGAGGEEGVRVTLLGLVSLLTRSYYKNGSNFTVTHSSQDATVIGKAVIDHFNTIYSGSLLSYDASSVPATVGTSVSYQFVDQKWLDAVKKAGELAGEGWWWTVDRNGKYNLKARPSSVSWTFTVGKDVVSINAVKDSEQVVNDVQVGRNGGTATNYTDATSQLDFGTGSPATGKRTEVVTDSSITDATTADARGQKLLADKKDEKVSATVVVNANADLEGIEVGQTCVIRNFRAASTFFPSAMQIVSLQYSGDVVSMELETQRTGFGPRLQQFVNG